MQRRNDKPEGASKTAEHEQIPWTGTVWWATIILMCWLLPVMVTPARAQELPYQYQHITSKDGLSHDSVYAVTQCNDGFMWFGTESGLNRYDGNHFKVYHHDPQNSATLSEDNIGVILPDSRGYLWVGTWGGGLNRFDPRTEKIERKTLDLLADERIQSLFIDSRDQLWVGTFYAGLHVMDADMNLVRSYYKEEGNPNSLMSNRIYAMVEDQQGRLWIGTSHSLSLLDPDRGVFKHFYTNALSPSGLRRTVCRALTLDDQGQVWAGTILGIDRIDPITLEISQFDETRRHSLINDYRFLYTDRSGGLWAGCYGDGLKQFDLESGRLRDFSRVVRGDPLDLGRIECIFQDRGGNLWVGTNREGVLSIQVEPKRFFLLRKNTDKPVSLSSNRIGAIVEDHQRNLWVGTSGEGLNRINRKTQEVASYRPGTNRNTLTDDIVQALLCDRQGRIWVGTYRGGLSRFRETENDFETVKNEQRFQNVRALLQDHKGLIWVGTGNGIYVLEEDQPRYVFHSEDDRNSLVYDRIYSMRESHDGAIWITTEDGVSQLDPKTMLFTNYKGDPNRADSLSHDRVPVVQESRDGTIWLGTQNGLNRFHEGRFERFFDATSELSLLIYGIEEDRDGLLWLGSSSGLVRFSPVDGNWRVFDTRDGVQGKTFSPYAYYAGPDGELFFGGPGGLTLFRPEEIHDNAFIPPVVITDFRVFNTSVSPGGALHHLEEIAINYNDKVVSFEFATLNYRNPEKNGYAYKLEGFHDHWVDADNSRSVTYTNLDPGEYVFRVKGSNDDGIWNDEEAAIRLLVEPPFWHRLWFRSLIALLICSLIWHRVRENRANTRLLERKVRERTRSLEFANRHLAQVAKDLNHTQQRLLTSAHRAGMAEIAVDILHNFGNVINSVSITVELMNSRVEGLNVPFLQRLVQLLEKQEGNLPEYFADGTNERMFREAIARFAGHLADHRKTSQEEIAKLMIILQEMRSLIQSQRAYAGADDFCESVDLGNFLDEVIRHQEALASTNKIHIKRRLETSQKATFPKHKMYLVFSHILKNACEALKTMPAGHEREVSIRISYGEDDQMICDISDNGPGIPEEIRTQIFNLGYTTRENGNGYGLHFCANTLKQIGGHIEVDDQPAGGTVFRLFFPREPRDE